MSEIDVNTTAKNPTYFLRGVELVKWANKEYQLLSENWPYPTRCRFGFATDQYYAEIWHDGMDWTNNYWLIETVNWDKPQIYPVVYFDDSSNRDKFNDYNFSEFLEAVMYSRRNNLWIKHAHKGQYYHSVWPFLRIIEPQEKLERCPRMVRHRFLHASQPRVEFYLNIDLIPPQQPVGNKAILEVGNKAIVTIESEYPIEEKTND
jgi:hypothetical protein